MATVIDGIQCGVDSTGRWRASARLRTATSDRDLWFASDVPLAATPEAFLTAAIIPAMASGEPVHMEAPTCRTFLSNLYAAQEILAAWHPHLSPVTVDAPVRADLNTQAERGCAAFFSGGVDSFDTVLRQRARLTHLVLVRGFDIRLSDDALWSDVDGHLQLAARALGLPLVRIETNIRAALDAAGDWGYVTNGAALASVGHLLSDVASVVLVPSSHHVTALFPWGSHPLLDSLWSSDTLTIVHEGAHLTRVQKVTRLVQDPVAMAHLRVCWQNTDGAYNCGHCAKCLRTMVDLSLADGLGRCHTLPAALNLDRQRIPVGTDNDASFAGETLDHARRLGRMDVVRALEYALWRHDAKVTLRGMRRLLSRMPLSQAAKLLAPKTLAGFRSGEQKTGGEKKA